MHHIVPVDEIPPDVPLLKGIEGPARERVLACLQATYIAYDAGELVREANIAQNYAAYLVRGKADGYVYDEEGNRSILHLFVSGQVISYGKVFGSSSWSSFDVVAREECRIILFNTDHVPVNCEQCQRYVAQVERNLAQAVADLDAEIMTTLNIRLRRTMRGKVLAFLEYEARRRGTNEFDIAFNRQELADYLCVDRAALSRELASLRDEGQFDFERNHFVVHLKPKLRKGAPGARQP